MKELKKGSLVKIKESHNKKYIDTFAIVMGIADYYTDVFRVQRFLDGSEDGYHHTRLEVICEGR